MTGKKILACEDSQINKEMYRLSNSGTEPKSGAWDNLETCKQLIFHAIEYN